MNKTLVFTSAALAASATAGLYLYSQRALTPPESVSDATCLDAPNGTACGAVELGMQCWQDACGKNTCGDGIVLGKEQCDDGNTRVGDGCSPSCTWEALAECGNGNVDRFEECDDGNTVDEDACTLRCNEQRCGDGAKAANEECDDGNADDTDACTSECKRPSRSQRAAAGERRSSGYEGTNTARGEAAEAMLASGALPGLGVAPAAAPRDARGLVVGAKGSVGSVSAGSLGGSAVSATSGAQGQTGTSSASHSSGSTSNSPALGVATSPLRAAGEIEPEELCKQCRNRYCRNYQETDLVAGCYESVDGKFGAPANDATFLQACQDVMECAQANGCGYDREQASKCYCGSTSIDDCAARGPASDAPCVTEWQIATRTEENVQVLERMTQMNFPAAWAFHLLECERTFCPPCVPKT